MFGAAFPNVRIRFRKVDPPSVVEAHLAFLEVARDLPRKTLELLGYAAHDGIAAGGGFLGAVDLRDPVDLLEKGEL